MTSALQNRLVGTIIVVAIAVIFLPDLLDGKKQSTQNTFIDLPSQPIARKVEAPSDVELNKIKEMATRKVEIVSEQAIDDSADYRVSEDVIKTADHKVVDVKAGEQSKVKETEKLTTSETKTVVVGSLEKDTIVEQNKDQKEASAGWVVQLGSFRNKKNVNELLNVLEKAGYRAFSRPVTTSSGILTKVFVGPDLQKSKLEDSLSHLKEVTKLQGRVTPFTVQ